jgi:serine/threonine-protein kinase
MILYELFTGKRVFQAKTIADYREHHRTSRPVDPSTFIAGFDPGIERVILDCLAKDPATRPASVRAVAHALPGGDPLAAAIALGKTPSPELIAAAGEQAGLKPMVALILLATLLAAVAVYTGTSGRLSPLRALPAESSPELLKARAREILRSFHYSDEPGDEASGFIESEVLHAVRESGLRRSLSSPSRPAATVSDPAAFGQWWYRESPRPLINSDFFSLGRVDVDAPAHVISGMTTVWLDLNGRLTAFEAVAPQVSAPDTGPSQPDWGALFTAAGLEPSRFQRIAPEWNPPVYADARAAWSGSSASSPEVPLRLEASAALGRIVTFRIVSPWTTPARMERQPAPRGALGVLVAMSAIGMIVLVGVVLLARHNLRSGRGDLKGARRVGVWIFGLAVAGSLLEAHYPSPTDIPAVASSFQTVIMVIGFALVLSSVVCLMYVALEPQARRWWPESMVTWSRLLAGRWRDPLLGRDLLVGGVFGTVIQIARLIQLIGASPRTVAVLFSVSPLSISTAPRFLLVYCDVSAARSRTAEEIPGCLRAGRDSRRRERRCGAHTRDIAGDRRRADGAGCRAGLCAFPMGTTSHNVRGILLWNAPIVRHRGDAWCVDRHDELLRNRGPRRRRRLWFPHRPGGPAGLQ